MEDIPEPALHEIRREANGVTAFAVRVADCFEHLHSGIVPSTKSGDYTDVKVVTPYGEIPWNEVSRFSNAELATLLTEISTRLSQLLLMRHANEPAYQSFVELWIKHVAAGWDETPPTIDQVDELFRFDPPVETGKTNSNE